MSTLGNEDLKITCATDRPKSGMWHNGPNPTWVEVTHLPTMISARMYGHSQHKALQAAMACVEMMVAESRYDKCSFPQRVYEMPQASPSEAISGQEER